MTLKPPDGLTEDDYERIEEAVMETARGRWFLSEFARRIRAQDTQRVLDAIARLERASLPVQMEHAQVHARAIGERLMDIGWRLRECGFDDAMCHALEREASAVLALAGEEGGPALARELAAPARPEPAPEAAERPVTLDALDRLPTREKLRAFA